jgi:hypothetical protein
MLACSDWLAFCIGNQPVSIQILDFEPNIKWRFQMFRQDRSVQVKPKKLMVVILVSTFWFFLVGFSSVGEYQAPVPSNQDPVKFGLSLSGSMVPCMGCASNADQSCVLWGGDLWFGFNVHQAGSLRFRLSVMNGMADREEGSHSDFAGNLYLGSNVEYMLSNSTGGLAMLVGTSLNLWNRNNRDEIELLAVVPYLGGIVAFRDPGLVRPYITARLGGSVHPDLKPYASLTFGLELPQKGDAKIMTELIATASPAGEAFLPSVGLGVGVVF